MKVKFYLEKLLSNLSRPLIRIEKTSEGDYVQFDLTDRNSANRIFEHTFGEAPKWLELKAAKLRLPACKIFYNAYLVKDGIIVNDKNEVVWDSILSSNRYLDIQYANHYILSKKKRKCQVVDYCITLDSPLANNYFHWLFESLAGIIDYDFEKAEDLKFIISSGAAKYIHESLAFFFNIKHSAIIKKETIFIKAKKLILPSLTFFRLYPLEDYSSIYDPAIFIRLNNSVKSKINKHHKTRNILISRAKAWQRRLVNEKQVISEFQQLGMPLELVESEGLSFKEQIELFASSKIIICAHGAGMSNIVFAQEKSIVIELFPGSRLVRDAFFYYQLTKALDFHHLIMKVDSINSAEDMELHLDQIQLIHDFILRTQDVQSQVRK